MKKLDALILRSFIGPFAASFAVALFILVIQFLSRYQDMIAGKGLGGDILLKLFIYASAHLVILALPLAVLISSLMTMGNLGAQYELAAIKSSGISIHRLITPILYFCLGLFVFSLWFSFFVVPKGNLKLFSLMWDIQQTKPTFALKAGHFYKGIDGYSLRAARKDKTGSQLEEVMIYNHVQGKGNIEVVLADSARMALIDKGMTLQMQLYRGCRYEEIQNSEAKPENKPFSRYYFDSLRFYFDMSGFGLKRSDESAFSPHHKMMNILQLTHVLDSLSYTEQALTDEFVQKQLPQLVRIDSVINNESIPELNNHKSLPKLAFKNSKIGVLSTFPDNKWYEILSRSVNNARAIRNFSDYTLTRMKEEEEILREYKIEYHSKFMLPLTCLIFLYIGAPLGAIIRKGGVGMPMVVSVCFFIFFWFLMMQGTKLSKQDVLDPWAGIWLPIYVLTPIAGWITWKASNDSPLFDSSSYLIQWNRVKSLFKGNNNSTAK